MGITTRVNPRTDILNPIPGGRGQTFMPAERMTAGEKQWTASNTQFEGGMGIDATVPFGYESDFFRPVYPVDRSSRRTSFPRRTSGTPARAWQVGCIRWHEPAGKIIDRRSELSLRGAVDLDPRSDGEPAIR